MTADKGDGEGPMLAVRHCWWCGREAEVNTELPEDGGMVRDGDMSWLCADSEACAQRALEGRFAEAAAKDRAIIAARADPEVPEPWELGDQ